MRPGDQMENSGARPLNRSRPSCLTGPTQRTDFFHGLLIKSIMIDKLKPGLLALAGIVRNPTVARDIAGALAHGRFDDARRMACTAHLKADLRSEKIVSDRYRYLWICVPKVASRSFVQALQCADPDAEVFVNKRLCDVYAMRPQARDYYSFAFVRHPFDRALSFYRELHVAHTIYAVEDRKRKEEKRRRLFSSYYGLAETADFDDFCRWLNTPYGSDAFAERHFLSQHRQVRAEDGRLPDFVGCLETIDADLGRVAAHLGMPVPVLPMWNTMAGWEASPDVLQTTRRAVRDALLTEWNKELLRTRYASDLELWAEAGQTVGGRGTGSRFPVNFPKWRLGLGGVGLERRARRTRRGSGRPRPSPAPSGSPRAAASPIADCSG